VWVLPVSAGTFIAFAAAISALPSAFLARTGWGSHDRAIGPLGNMRVLVTGSAGHLGEALMRTLADSADEVLGLDIKPSPFT